MLRKLCALGCGVGLALAMGTASAGDAEAGKAKYGTCAGCHGPNGKSLAPTYPSLAGMSADTIKAALSAYKSGAKDNATMKAMASGLSDADIDNLATYIASFPAP
jgi:cytochrome c553